MSSEPFRSVVCGLDGTREAFEAARQAARLASPDGRLVLVAAAQYERALGGAWGPEPVHLTLPLASERRLEELMDELRGRARESLERAQRQVAGAVGTETRVVDGWAPDRLRDVAVSERATLIALGAHGGRRLSEALLGGVATTLLHDAPVSVLLARWSFDPMSFPRRIVVGFDGSEAARHALDVAARLRERSRGELVVVAATRDEDVELAELARLAAPHELVPRDGRPVEALTEAAETADLVILGARGLRGARALGSVSERVAHRAASSVLVVRPEPAPAG